MSKSDKVTKKEMELLEKLVKIISEPAHPKRKPKEEQNHGTNNT